MPNFKILIDTNDVTSTLANEYAFVKGMDYAAKMQSLAITEEEQVLMRGICNLASGKELIFSAFLFHLGTTIPYFEKSNFKSF